MYLQIIVDPSGNSFVENPHAPRSDPHREVSHFLRSREQDHALGFYTDAEVNNRVNSEREAEVEVALEEKEASSTASTTSSTLLLRCQEGEVGDEASLEGKAEGAAAVEATGIDLLDEVALPRVLSASTTSTALGTQNPTEKKQQPQQLDLTDEVLNFPTNCPECSSPADTKMKVTSEYNLYLIFPSRSLCYMLLIKYYVKIAHNFQSFWHYFSFHAGKKIYLIGSF